MGRAFWEALDGGIERLLSAPEDRQGWHEMLTAVNGIAFGPLARCYRASLCGEARRRTARRLGQGRPRSVWGVTPVVSIIPCAAADRLLVAEADSLVLRTYYITRDFDLRVDRVMEWVERDHPGLVAALHHAVLAWTLLRYDVFHYFNDRGILPPTGDFGLSPDELDLLHRSKKWLFTYGYGADFRSRERTLALGPFNNCMDCPEPEKFCVCSEQRRATVIGRVAPYAHGMHSMADGHHYIPGSIRSYYWPLDLSRLPPPADRRAPAPDSPLTIAHSPNHGEFKGTRLLVDAVASLRDEGVPVRLDLVSGVANREVLERFQRADVVADQFINGYHGYTALEAMALGKPVLCYLRDPADILAPQDCPIINTHPQRIESVLRELAMRREDLAAIGRRSRAYVERYYSIEAFAGRLQRVYEQVGLLRCEGGAREWNTVDCYVPGDGRATPAPGGRAEPVSSAIARTLFPLAVRIHRAREASRVAAPG